MDERELLALSEPAWRLAVRILGRVEGAEDVVQQACLVAVRQMRSGPPPAELRTWFLTVVANAARKHLRTEARRARREADVSREDRTTENPEAGSLSRELVAALRGALERLEEKYRVPVALCCEEGLSQREAAAVLEMPESTVNKYVSVGLERLRAALSRAGYAAAPAMVIGGLKMTAPVVPASLVVSVKGFLKSGAIPGAAGAAAGAAGLGLAWKLLAALSLAAVLAGGLALGIKGFGGGRGGDGTLPAVGPVPGPATVLCAPGTDVKFTAGPTVTKVAETKYKIDFTVSAPTDVEVAILDAQGKVVRSLAAGVLGAKLPPPEPLKPGLSQTLEWDGVTGDWGKKAEGGPFKVRVRAGMGVKFGRMVGDSPYNFYNMYCRGMAVDQKNGDLYYMALLGRGAHLFCLRVYDRTGKYLREIMPYPAALDAKSREVYGSLPVPGSETPAPLNRMSLWPVFYPVVSKGGGVDVKLMAMHPTEPDTLVLADEYFGAVWRIRKTDGGAGAPFDEGLWDAGKAPTGIAVGPVMGAISPDGRTMYFTGYCGVAPKGQKLNPKWPDGRIYRMEPGKGKTATFADVALPESWPPAGEPWAVPSNGRQALHGIAVDKDGNVLVCDAAGGKVRVFSPDGKESGAIDAPGAYVAVPDLKTGALYVLTRAELGDRKLGANAVVKYESAKPGAKAMATLQLKRGSLWLAGDFSGPAPQLWVADAPKGYSQEIARGNLFRIEEKNDRLELAEDLAERGNTAAGSACRLDVDPEADLVYVHNGWGRNLRYNGLTGEYADKLGKDGQPELINGAELCVRRDGTIYRSGGNEDLRWSGPWHRLNRDLSPAPLADGRKEFAGRAGKMGGGYYGNQGSCATPDGHLYFNGMFGFRINAIFEVNPDGNPGRGSRLKDVLPGSPDLVKITGGFKGALIGPIQDQSGGLEIDQQGCLYVGMNVQVRGCEPPAELAKTKGIGAVVKFGPDGGAMLPDPEKVKPGTKYECYKNLPLTMPEKIGPGLAAVTADYWAPGLPGGKLLEGALKAYPLLAPFSCYEGCACQTPRFEVDDYGRVYIPNAYTCSVRVVDNEGNEITRFGSYGNFDSQGPESKTPKPEIPLAYPVAAKASFKHIYVADSANRRVVRVDPTWKAEAACDVK